MSRGISGTGIADFAPSTDEPPSTEGDSLDLKVMTVEYTDTRNGPVVHAFCREADGTPHHIEVKGHNPSFYIRKEAYNQRIDNHYAVSYTETHDPESGDRYETLHGEPLVRVYTYQSEQVGEMRDLFEETWEADVFYDRRWAIDNGIYTGMRVDLSEAVTDEPWLKGDMRVNNDAVEPLSLEETPSVDPKQLVVDIEVAGEDGFPDADRAEYPVTTIVAWDSDSEEYVGWILESDEWDEETRSEMWHDSTVTGRAGLDKSKLFEDESAMLHDFNEYVADQRADILTGWYSNDFDIPYLINRSRDLNVYNYQDWSPLGDVYLTKFDPVVKGMNCVDMLEAYKKTQRHNLKRKGLDDVAQKELGDDAGKVELSAGDDGDDGSGLSHTEMWRQKPVEFLRYNKVDVELVHRIDESRGVIEMLDNLRAVAGVSYTNPIGGNIDMMDVVVLRKAQDYGYALPTAEKPSVGDFHGAYVYTPEPGLHEHVVYPDYSSLYPNVMYQCNISPETLVGTAEDLEESEWDEEDCVWTYVDLQTAPSLKEGVEASDEKMEKLYFLDPSVEEGFVRSVLDDVMGMASQYTGGMYAAAKRVRNSIYGVFGDSDSYGTGFRLFDWRLAEGTTLGGQKVLKAGAERFIEASPDADSKVVGGDTDSVMTTFPSAETPEQALEWAEWTTKTVNEWLDDFAVETFGLSGVEEARMELELESYADGLFFKADDEGRSDDGVKKRYVQRIIWDEEDGWLEDPSIGVKGFEYVRSDVADVTADVQYATFESLMSLDIEDAERAVKAHIERVISDIMTGDYPLGEVAVPFGISQPLSNYGQNGRGMPWYHGAKYANEFIYEGEAIESGGDPFYLYVEPGKTGAELPSTFRAPDAAQGDYVNCIAVLDAEDLPEDVVVDREKMVEKTVIDPLSGIFRTLGWGVDWLRDAVEAAKTAEDYRDDGQSGLEQFKHDETMDAERFM